MADTPELLRRWLSNAHPIGPAVRSDWALADMMARQITTADAPVIVLGANAVSFAHTIIRNGVPPAQVALVEHGSELSVTLRQRYPETRILWSNAVELGSVSPFGRQQAGAIVSTLPLRYLPVGEALVTLNAAFWQIRDGGAFYQVTSAPHCPVQKDLLDRLCLDACQVDATDADNLPFALYRLTRKPAASRLQPLHR
jgi:phospholipid N-methyltransferase